MLTSFTAFKGFKSRFKPSSSIILLSKNDWVTPPISGSETRGVTVGHGHGTSQVCLGNLAVGWSGLLLLHRRPIDFLIGISHFMLELEEPLFKLSSYGRTSDEAN